MVGPGLSAKIVLEVFGIRRVDLKKRVALQPQA